MSEKVWAAMARAVVEENVAGMARYIFANGQIWGEDFVDPWQRELKRARKQLSKIGA